MKGPGLASFVASRTIQKQAHYQVFGEVPGRQEQLIQTSTVHLWKKHLFSLFRKAGGAAPLGPPWPTLYDPSDPVLVIQPPQVRV